jgi:hypothetical protein
MALLPCGVFCVPIHYRGTFSGGFRSGGTIGPERILDKALGMADGVRLTEICKSVRANFRGNLETTSGRVTPSTPVMLVLARTLPESSASALAVSASRK